MAASVSQLSGLAPPSPLPCERCGYAPPSARVAVGGRRVCTLCAEHLAREARPAPPLWPTFYVFAMGVLSPIAPPVLAAINWWRLGEPRRVKSAVVLALAALATSIGQSVAVFENLPHEEQIPFTLANLLIALFSTIALAPRYAEHRERGGPRANLLVPVLASMVVMATLGLAVLGYLSLTGKVDPNEVLSRDPFQAATLSAPSNPSAARTSSSGVLQSEAQSVPNSGRADLPSR